jgi:peptidoglycan/LPS O-acetylase OafA/YrhL
MKRLECLDGLRGVLAVYVLLGHLAPFAQLPAVIQSAVSHGTAAVDLFFVLSGLVIIQSLHAACGRAGPFLIGRIMRIFPVFLVVFAFAVAVQSSSCGFEHMPWITDDNVARRICAIEQPHAWTLEIIAHLTMTHGLFPNAILPDVWVSFLGSAWSLSTEWQFYLLALALVSFAAAAGTQDKKQKTPRFGTLAKVRSATVGPSRLDRLCWVLLGSAVASVVWQAAVPEGWQFTRAFLPNEAHFFALGVTSVGVVRQDRGARVRYALVLAVTLAVCAAQGSFGKMLPPLAWTLCLAAQMRTTTVGLRQIGWILRTSAARYLGSISYCLYLVNEPVLKVVGALLSRLAGGNAALFTLMWVPLAIGLPLLVSAWLHIHLEAPALRWGRSAARTWAGTQPGGAMNQPSVQARSRGL